VVSFNEFNPLLSPWVLTARGFLSKSSEDLSLNEIFLQDDLPMSHYQGSELIFSARVINGGVSTIFKLIISGHRAPLSLIKLRCFKKDGRKVYPMTVCWAFLMSWLCWNS